MFGVPERLSAFSTRTFPAVITKSVVQDLSVEKWLIIHCVACIVTEPNLCNYIT
jgi:hypothetical protein